MTAERQPLRSWPGGFGVFLQRSWRRSNDSCHRAIAPSSSAFWLLPIQRHHSQAKRKTLRRGTRRRIDERSAPARREFVYCPVGDAKGHDVRNGHSDRTALASVPGGGTFRVTNRLTVDEAKRRVAGMRLAVQQAAMPATGRRASDSECVGNPCQKVG